MSIRLSCDDACASDVRLAELAIRYGIECTFYWPVEWHSLVYEKGYKPLTYADAIDIAKRFEIGAHTITHRHLTKISDEAAKYEITASRIVLEDILGIQGRIKKFCPPRGYTTPALTDFTLQFYESQRLTKGEGLVHIHPFSGANDNKPWRECIDENTKELWCHSWELDKYNLWGELEGFLESNSR